MTNVNMLIKISLLTYAVDGKVSALCVRRWDSVILELIYGEIATVGYQKLLDEMNCLKHVIGHDVRQSSDF